MTEHEAITPIEPTSTSQAQPSAQAPTPLEQLIAPPIVSLKEFRKVREADSTPPVPTPAAATSTPETPEPPATRERDEKGRFLTQPTEEPTGVVAPADEKAPKKSDAVKRINELTLRLRETERRTQIEIDRLTRDLTDARATRTPSATAPVTPSAPTPEAFPKFEAWQQDHGEASYEDYLDARAERRVEQTLAAERAHSERASVDRAVQVALHHISTQGPSRHADFGDLEQAAFESNLQWAPHITEFVLRQTDSAEEAIDLTYVLLKEPALVDRLNRLPPGRAWFELGKLAVSPPSVAAPTGPVTATAPVTRAPAPIRPAGTSALASTPTVESLIKGREVSLRRFREARGR